MYFTNNALRWLECILKERFGHAFVLIQEMGTLKMFLSSDQGIIVFDQLQPIFHQSRSDFHCEYWRASAEKFKAPIEDVLPAPSERELVYPLIEFHDQCATVSYDVLGLTYWMLARVEEVGRTDLDEHFRFPAISSHAHRHGYLDRPIVDEWLDILGQVITRIWPGISLKRHEFKIKVSHDVDSPSQYAFKSWPKVWRLMAGNLLKRKDLKAFCTAPYLKLASRSKVHPADPFNTFDWLMDVSDLNQTQSAFYFISGRTSPSKDGDYELEHPAIRSLLRRIHQRGHEIGLHPSYGTFQRADLVAQEAKRLLRVCEEEGIDQAEWGGRMHYLRWEQPTTLQGWIEAGFDYDSTLGYADHVGFRCGTCYDFPAFDVVDQEIMSLRLQPLIVMEQTLFSVKYMGGVHKANALNTACLLIDRCRAVSGCFSLLWHNSHFLTKKNIADYQFIMGRASGRC